MASATCPMVSPYDIAPFLDRPVLVVISADDRAVHSLVAVPSRPTADRRRRLIRCTGQVRRGVGASDRQWVVVVAHSPQQACAEALSASWCRDTVDFARHLDLGSARCLLALGELGGAFSGDTLMDLAVPALGRAHDHTGFATVGEIVVVLALQGHTHHRRVTQNATTGRMKTAPRMK